MKNICSAAVRVVAWIGREQIQTRDPNFNEVSMAMQFLTELSHEVESLVYGCGESGQHAFPIISGGKGPVMFNIQWEIVLTKDSLFRGDNSRCLGKHSRQFVTV